MIEVDGLRKLFDGRMRALDGVSFTAPAGCVTGLVGPNGSGKSTTMRIIAGQERADAGTATVDGKPLAKHPDPLHRIGMLLDPRSAHPGRTPLNHLRALAATHGIGRARVAHVLETSGLEAVDDRRIGTFSMGMRQRLGVATALLGDPSTLMLDEPVNGLDPDGVLWFRRMCRQLAEEGRAVLVSSHLMTELELTADRVVILGRGRVLADTTLEALTREHVVGVRICTPDMDRLLEALRATGVEHERMSHHEVEVTGVSAATIGELSLAHSIRLTELVTLEEDLESVYLRLTANQAEFRSVAAA